MDNNLQQSTQQNQSTVQQRKEREPEKLFTQEDVNRIVGERLSRVRQETGDAEAYKRERDEARKELEEYKSNAFLKAQGVREQDMDYVAFKARQLVDEWHCDFVGHCHRRHDLFYDSSGHWWCQSGNYSESAKSGE